MGLRSYNVESQARTLWADEHLRESQSEQELEWESNNEPEIVPDDSDSEPEIEQEWGRVSQSGSQVPCSQLIIRDNEREIGSQSVTMREELAHKPQQRRWDRLTRLTANFMQLWQGPRSPVRKKCLHFIKPWCTFYNNNLWNLYCAIKCEKVVCYHSESVWRILGLLEQAQKNLWKVFFFGDEATNKNNKLLNSSGRFRIFWGKPRCSRF